MRQQVNGVIYLLRNDSSLSHMPEGYGPSGTIHSVIYKWAKNGTLEKILGALGDPDLIAAAERRVKTFQKSHERIREIRQVMLKKLKERQDSGNP